MFNFFLLEEFRTYLSRIPIDYDLLVAIPVTEKVSTVTDIWPHAVVIPHTNIGFDIGSFFTMLDLIRGHSYDLLLKLHSKSMTSWRRELLDPILGSAEKVQSILTLFDNPETGLVGADKWLRTTKGDWGIHRHYINEICQRWEISKRDSIFVGGTMFWARASIFTTASAQVNLSVIISSLNTLDTFDWSWYIHAYPDLLPAGINSREAAINHWNKYGKKEGRVGNILQCRARGVMMDPDGQIEHTYERFLGLLVTATGQRVVGV